MQCKCIDICEHGLRGYGTGYTRISAVGRVELVYLIEILCPNAFTLSLKKGTKSLMCTRGGVFMLMSGGPSAIGLSERAAARLSLAPLL